MALLVGADPEVFFKKNGKYVSAIGLVGGTKHKPKRRGIGWVQEDNVMAEFNIPPAKTPVAFSESIKKMLDELEKIAHVHGCELAIDPIATFTKAELSHPQALHIGCDPDYSAWLFRENLRIMPEELGLVRTASGHVHIGVDDPDSSAEYRTNLVLASDLYLGVPSVLNSASLSDDVLRRKFYGKSGCFRPKPYGVEYRTLSNWWIKEDITRKWVFNQVQTVFMMAHKVQSYIKGGDIRQQEIDSIINTGNIQLAEKYIKRFGITLW